MNPYKLRWQIIANQIPAKRIHGELVENKKTVTLFKNKKYTKNDSAMKIFKEQIIDEYSYHPMNLKKGYQHPLGNIFVDVVLGLAIPATTVGKKAKKVINLLQMFSENLD